MTKELQTYILNQFTKGELAGEVISGGRRHRVIAERLCLFNERSDAWFHSGNDELRQLACRAAIAHYRPTEVSS